jgi:uncharacterized protein (TIGR00106 family)
MLVAFSMIPLDKGAHFSEYVARIIRTIEESGLEYQLTPMCTIIEGEWTPIFRLIDRCRKELRKESERVSIKIWVDDKAGGKGMLRGKVKSVEDKLASGRKNRRG